MDLRKIYESKWLKAIDLGNDALNGVIVDVDIVVFKSQRKDGSTYDNPQVCVKFEGIDKPFGLNKTNFEFVTTVSNLYNSDQWRGMELTLIPAEVRMQDGVKPTIKVAMVNKAMVPSGFQMHQVLPKPAGPGFLDDYKNSQNQSQQGQGLNQNQQNYNQAHQPQNQQNQMPRQQGGALGQSFSSTLDDEIPF